MTTIQPLDPDAVTATFAGCLVHGTGEFIEAAGIHTTARFDPERLAAATEQIDAWLTLLPTEFHATAAGGGGGWSFLNACQDINGVLWTGLHAIVEQLLLLGIARGRVVCQMPRELWEILPGGMPYYVINSAPTEAPSA